MSVLVQEIPAPSLTGATWAHVGPSLWVASTAGEFLGTVERVGDRFVACDCFALEIGTWDDLDSAKAGVAGHSAPTSRPARARHVPHPEMPLAWATALLAGLAVFGSLIWITWGA